MISPLLPGTTEQEATTLLDEVTQINPDYILLDSWHDHPLSQSRIEQILHLLPTHHRQGFNSYQSKKKHTIDLLHFIHDQGDSYGVLIIDAETTITPTTEY